LLDVKVAFYSRLTDKRPCHKARLGQRLAMLSPLVALLITLIAVNRSHESHDAVTYRKYPHVSVHTLTNASNDLGRQSIDNPDRAGPSIRSGDNYDEFTTDLLLLDNVEQLADELSRSAETGTGLSLTSHASSSAVASWSTLSSRISSTQRNPSATTSLLPLLLFDRKQLQQEDRQIRQMQRQSRRSSPVASLSIDSQPDSDFREQPVTLFDQRDLWNNSVDLSSSTVEDLSTEPFDLTYPTFDSASSAESTSVTAYSTAFERSLSDTHFALSPSQGRLSMLVRLPTNHSSFAISVTPLTRPMQTPSVPLTLPFTHINSDSATASSASSIYDDHGLYFISTCSAF
jgi:hypothetical protein